MAIAFTPSLPEVWFEIRSEQDLHLRAEQVLKRFVRDTEKELGTPLNPHHLGLQGKAWITTLPFEFIPSRRRPKKEETSRLFLGPTESLSGGEELERVGICLDWAYPGELDRVILRDRQVAQLLQLFSAPDKRPIRQG